MKDMFFNYDNKTNLNVCTNHCSHNLDTLAATPAVKLVTNIKDELLGIQVKHSNPFSLYFHLNDFGTAYETTAGSLTDLIYSSLIKFELITISGKVIFTKEFSAEDVLDSFTNNLKLDFTHEESKKLKKEAYKMSVKLCWGEDYFEIFTPANGLLIIR